MKQRHSYSRLLFHLVFSTKARGRLIEPADEAVLRGWFEVKAHELDSCIEEFGCFYDHVHLLVRSRPTLLLAELYRQLKGFSSRAWHIKFPERPFAWADGVYSATVDPEDNQGLREYIKNQRAHHAAKTEMRRWEPDETSP